MDCHELFQYYREVYAPAIDALEQFHEREENQEFLRHIYNEDTRYMAGDLAGNQSGHDGGAIYWYPEIHSEIRMAFTHLSRAALSCSDASLQSLLMDNIGSSPVDYMGELEQLTLHPFEGKKADEELDQAFKHLQRAAMDSVKCLYLVKTQKNDYNLSRCSSFSVHMLDNGKFFSNIGEMKQSASIFFEKAKIAESLGAHDKAYSLYNAANEEMTDLELYLESKSASLSVAKKKYYKKLESLRPAFIIFLASLAFFIFSVIFGE